MDKRIIAVNSNCYHGFSIEEALDGIKDAGFQYIELTATKGWTEHVFPDQSFEYLLKIKNKMKELGIIPFSMSGHCNLMDRERIKDFIANIELAKFFGCKYIVSSIGEAHLEDKATLADEYAAENIKLLLPILTEYDMQLVLETHGEHSTGERVSKIIDMIASPYIRLNYDTANVIFYGRVLPHEDIKSCIDNIAYIHLKDKAGEYTEWDFPALGKGYVDFEQIFKILEDNKNNSPFSIEIEFTKEGAKDVNEVNEAVKASARYLTDLGFEL